MMTQTELKENSRYLYAKLRNMPFCYKCGQIIDKNDEIEYNRIKHFRGRVEYKFYHKKCLESENMSEQERWKKGL